MPTRFDRVVSPSELIDAGERLFGREWRRPLASALDRDVSTIYRWATAKVAVPKTVALAIRQLLEDQSRGQARKR